MTRTPLRTQLLLIAVAAILPLAGLSAIGLSLIFEQQRTVGQHRAQEMTRALASAVDAELKRSIAALQILAASTELDDFDFAQYLPLARRALQSQPSWRSLIIAETNGRQVVHTDFPPGAVIPPNPEPATLQEVARTSEARIGRLVMGRVGHAFAIRVPLRQKGEVRYVLSAVLTPEPILDIIRKQNVASDWVISVFDATGTRVARSRLHEKYVAMPASSSLREMMEKNGTEGAGMTQSLEGDSVFTAYTRIPDTGWTVAIGLPETMVSGPALRSTAIYAIALALSILAGLIAAFMVSHRVNRQMSDLRGAAQLLGVGGEPEVVRTTVREIEEVADALAAAARQRRASEAEREELLRREKAARAEAEAANLAKDQFLAMLGHELRNPLAAISNATGLLELSGDNPQTTARSREIIRRQVTHLSRLTDDLLDAARAVLGKIELRSEPVDLAAIAGQALAALTASGRANGWRITADLREAWVMGDAVRLDQVATNLLVNAVKYTPQGGSITLTTGREGGAAVLRVVDSGIGLSPELAARAFDLFVQGRRELDRSQGGLGIGLTLVRRIAELHGGSATVNSEGEGCGSEFVVRMPAVERPATRATPSARGATLARTILIIEDNQDARDTLRALLELMGHRVETAPDGARGLEKALALDPDVALIDLGLPGMSGFDVARRLRASSAGPSIYLVALTGYGSSEDRTRALEAGFDEHVTKPVSPAALEQLLAKAFIAA